MNAVAASLLTIAEARALVLDAVQPLAGETLSVTDALDRVLAEDVLAAGDVPPFPCSAMDGYAVLAGPAERRLTVVGESRAGTPAIEPLRDGQAIRISTGGAIPAGATAVIPQENIEAHDGEIITRAPVREGDNLRHVGEDMRAGVTILKAGSVLGAAELGAAVAAGAG